MVMLWAFSCGFRICHKRVVWKATAAIDSSNANAKPGCFLRSAMHTSTANSPRVGEGTRQTTILKKNSLHGRSACPHHTPPSHSIALKGGIWL
eukprot:1620742-Amphidinium_carterae.1